MSRELEFVVDSKSLEPVTGLTIRANFDEMKEALVDVTKPYKNMVVSADGVAAAKNDRAKIRKVEKSIDDYRKMVKKTYEAPLKEFEAKCKELTNICKEASDNLDEQVKAFDKMRREEIMGYLLNVFNDRMTDLARPYAKWERIADERWSNATFNLNDAEKEIKQYIGNVEEHVKAIHALGSDFEVELLEHYAVSGDLGSVLNLNMRLLRRRQEVETASIPKTVREKVVPVPKRTSEENDIRCVEMRIFGTVDQFSELAKFLKSNGYRYEKI